MTEPLCYDLTNLLVRLPLQVPERWRRVRRRWRLAAAGETIRLLDWELIGYNFTTCNFRQHFIYVLTIPCQRIEIRAVLC